MKLASFNIDPVKVAIVPEGSLSEFLVFLINEFHSLILTLNIKVHIMLMWLKKKHDVCRHERLAIAVVIAARWVI
jgi:hypothetical protein